MAVAVTTVGDSLAVQGYHYLITGLAAGKNSVTLAPSDFNWVAKYAVVQCVYDASHTTASKVMYDYRTFTNVLIDIYCDATGSTSVECWLY